MAKSFCSGLIPEVPRIAQCCTKCGLVKVFSHFRREAACRTGHNTVCTDCCRERDRLYRRAEYRANPEFKARVSAQNKRYHLKRKYGLTVAEFSAMKDNQHNLCAICGQSLMLLRIDHSHDTGKVRGLLCMKCNSGLGLFNDSPATLQKAAQYIIQGGFCG